MESKKTMTPRSQPHKCRLSFPNNAELCYVICRSFLLGIELDEQIMTRKLSQQSSHAIAYVAADLTDDAFLGGGLNILQPQKGYRAGMDAVLLAAAVPAQAGELILEAGSGVGVAALCLARRVPGARVVGLEIQPNLVDIAVENSRRNCLTDNVEFVAGDILRTPAAIKSLSFDHFICNPPYFDRPGAYRLSDTDKHVSNMGTGAQLEDFIDWGLKRLKPRGRITLIHKAERLEDIIALCHGRVGDIRVLPVWPRAGEVAIRVIVSGQKGAKSPLKLLAGFAMHEEGLRYSRQAEAHLRDGAPIVMDA